MVTFELNNPLILAENSTPAFLEFLDMLGQRVRLKGFDGYRGGHDTRGDTTGRARSGQFTSDTVRIHPGTHSIYTTHQQHSIMFHVSTMMPYTPSNRQQLARKRHIGNDMVTIIFQVGQFPQESFNFCQEPGALPFNPMTVRSHFQHVFIIVRANNPCSDSVSYR
jgi:hypothetical protein